MSTAIGHGLADPKRREKSVSQANEGGMPSGAGGQRPVFDLRKSARPLRSGGGGTPSAKPVSKGKPVNIPEPEGWTGCRRFEPTGARCVARCAACLKERGLGGIQAGGNAKPTFGTLAVTPGRDLFSS